MKSFLPVLSFFLGENVADPCRHDARPNPGPEQSEWGAYSYGSKHRNRTQLILYELFSWRKPVPVLVKNFKTSFIHSIYFTVTQRHLITVHLL
jgi:hypothetical protein